MESVGIWLKNIGVGLKDSLNQSSNDLANSFSERYFKGDASATSS